MEEMSDWFASGLSAFQKRDFVEAERLFSKALEVSPTNPNYLYYRASAFVELGKPKEAEADFSTALEMVESLPIRYSRGEFYLSLGEMEKAAADFSKVLEDSTTEGRYWRALAYLGRGLISLEAGDIESAVFDLGDAEDLAKEEGDTALLARISSELERSGF